MKFWAVLFAVLGWAGSCFADSSDEALAWLARMSNSAQRLGYAGTFVYQTGKYGETSRIVHLNDATGEYERLEVLDGAPREIVRANGEVNFYLPNERTLITDRVAAPRFPAWGAIAPSNLKDYYRVSLGGLDRVAGLDAQIVILEPRDEFRFGHEFWVDPASGLMLKSRMTDKSGELIEQFTFSEVKIGGTIGQDRLRSRYARDTSGWRVINACGEPVRAEDADWVVQKILPGFKQISMVRRPLKRKDAEALHMVFSDGLATLSVFIEPLAGRSEPPQPGSSAAGSTQIYKRIVGNDFLITALGEAPAAAVKRIADGVELRNK
jgi:sigma-E factor negative regulatory protein RseB